MKVLIEKYWQGLRYILAGLIDYRYEFTDLKDFEATIRKLLDFCRRIPSDVTSFAIHRQVRVYKLIIKIPPCFEKRKIFILNIFHYEND